MHASTGPSYRLHLLHLPFRRNLPLLQQWGVLGFHDQESLDQVQLRAEFFPTAEQWLKSRGDLFLLLEQFRIDQLLGKAPAELQVKNAKAASALARSIPSRTALTGSLRSSA